MNDGRAPRMTERVARRSQGGESELDRKFWGSIPPAERLAAAWEMVLEAMAIKGRSDVEQGLQRSAESVQHLGADREEGGR